MRLEHLSARRVSSYNLAIHHVADLVEDLISHCKYIVIGLFLMFGVRWISVRLRLEASVYVVRIGIWLIASLITTRTRARNQRTGNEVAPSANGSANVGGRPAICGAMCVATYRR